MLDGSSRRNRWIRLASGVLLGWLVTSGPTRAVEPHAGKIAIIPQPMAVEHRGAAFVFNDKTTILYEKDDKELKRIATYLHGLLADARPRQPKLADKIDPDERDSLILLSASGEDKQLGDEGYRLMVDGGMIAIRANTTHGLYYGVQTLRQLLQANNDADQIWKLPGVHVIDKPRFTWRGMHLDISRHHTPLDEMKKIVDVLAYHKMNAFHLHLSDDQGWRLHSRQYPKLSGTASYRVKDKIPYGGSFGAAEMRDLVKYANERFVTVVPEIEMPGHCLAVLAAYPSLSCTGGPFEVPTTWGEFEDIFCAGNNATYFFLERMLDEILEIFSSEYVHIGGKDIPLTRWKECEKCQAKMKERELDSVQALKAVFLGRINTYLAAHRRTAIVWDDMLKADGVPPGALVLADGSIEEGISAAQKGHDVILAPASRFTLSRPEPADKSDNQSDTELPIERVYVGEILPPDLEGDVARRVRGLRCHVWTEHISTPDQLETTILPSLSAVAEVAWTPPEGIDLRDFQSRLETHVQRLKAMKFKIDDEANKPTAQESSEKKPATESRPKSE